MVAKNYDVSNKRISSKSLESFWYLTKKLNEHVLRPALYSKREELASSPRKSYPPTLMRISGYFIFLIKSEQLGWLVMEGKIVQFSPSGLFSSMIFELAVKLEKIEVYKVSAKSYD